MKKSLLKTLLFFLLAFNLSAQSSILDSIRREIEKDNQLREQTRKAQFDAKGKTAHPFSIDAEVHDIDYAGGVDVIMNIGYYNQAKTIKYMYITMIPYNAVGDRVFCSIRRRGEFTGTITGPIKADSSTELHIWGAAWYNSTVACIKLTKVKVEYTDGTSYTYITELPKILADGFKNDCSYR